MGYKIFFGITLQNLILCLILLEKIGFKNFYEIYFVQDGTAARAFSDEAANILERAISGVLSRNALLYFAYADFEEGRMKYDKVHQMYNKFLGLPDVDPTLVSFFFIICGLQRVFSCLY